MIRLFFPRYFIFKILAISVSFDYTMDYLCFYGTWTYRRETAK